MRYVVTGAGQIGTQLTRDLISAGHDVVVIRRGREVVDGAELFRGDAGDRDLLRRAVGDPDRTAAVFHCIHTSYDSRAWSADLPQREQAVMDVAAEQGIPVIFPESVYAFGTGARALSEEVVASAAPVSPLGRVRAALLDARREHPARTLSVVAADLVGPTADPKTSVFTLMVLGPASRGRTARVLGDPDVPRSVTYIPDLSTAMTVAAVNARELAPDGDAVVVAPSTATMTQRQMAGTASPSGRARVRHLPWWILGVAGKFSPMMRELRDQRYLWDARATIAPGILETRFGVRPTPWDRVLAESTG